MGYSHAICPYDGMLYSAPIEVRAQEIMYFRYMHERDRNELFKGVEGLQRDLDAKQRACESGIMVVDRLPDNEDPLCGSTPVKH